MTCPFLGVEHLVVSAKGFKEEGLTLMFCTRGYWAVIAGDGDMLSFYINSPNGSEYRASGDFVGWLAAFSHCRFEALQMEEWSF